MNEEQLVEARDNALSRLNSSLSLLAAEGGESHSFALIDAKEFIFDFYVSREIRTYGCEWVVSDDVSRPNFCLEFNFVKEDKEDEDKTVHGKVYFYGKGIWRYSFDIKEVNKDKLYKKILESKDALEEFYDSQSLSTYSYEGEANRWRHPMKDDECNHIFSFASGLDGYLSVKEEFNTVPVKMYGVNSGLRKWDDRVAAAWHVGYYDGPLSGFCYLHKELHYFHMVEEKAFSGDRLYSIHPLSWIDKVRAYGSHFLWEQRITKNRIKLYERLRFLFNPKKRYDSKPSIGACTY
jgi:hypothetical protein